VVGPLAEGAAGVGAATETDEHTRGGGGGGVREIRLGKTVA